MKQTNNDTTKGEIFFLEVPDGKAGEILPNEDWNYFVSPSFLQENLCRVRCVGQPRIQHSSFWCRRGFGRTLSFQLVDHTVSEYNRLLQLINNCRMAFFVPDEQGHVQMLYNSRGRSRLNVVGTDEVNHKICVEPDEYSPYRTPITLLVREDGSPMTMDEFETLISDSILGAQRTRIKTN